MNSRRTVLLSLVGLAAALAVGMETAHAGKKPPPPPVPGGKIWFTYHSSMWSMNTDGSGKAASPAAVGGASARGDPTRLFHGGHRWFIGTQRLTGSYYTGTTLTRSAIVAVRDDGAVVTELVNEPDLNCSIYSQWSPDDTKVTIFGQRVVGGVWGPYAVYTPRVLFDVDGNVSGLVSQPATPDVALTSPSMITADWSPDGTQLVVALRDTSGWTGPLWIADLVSGALRQLPTASIQGPTWPVWSPDGSRIAYNSTNKLLRIAPDGTGAATVFTSNQGDWVNYPCWSPDATYLVFRFEVGSGPRDVLRIPAVGGTAVNLTSDINTNTWAGGFEADPVGWR